MPDSQAQIDLDILAFVNGQLDGERRYAVAEFLSQNPDRAAEVMADLRLTEALRLALGTVDTPAPPALLRAGDRLATGVSRRLSVRRWLPYAAALVLFAAGWAAEGFRSDRIAQSAAAADIAALFEAALDATEAVNLRLALSDDLGPMPRDPSGIAARLGIELPDLPQDWSIAAAQVVATPERPGVALLIDTPDLGQILLFSVLRSIDGPDEPADATIRDGRVLAFFERDRTAYVLVDSAGTSADLRLGAEALRHRFN